MSLLFGKDGATRMALTALWLEANKTNALKKIGSYPLNPIPIQWVADGSICFFQYCGSDMELGVVCFNELKRHDAGPFDVKAREAQALDAW
jgi:hypothetical protein